MSFCINILVHQDQVRITLQVHTFLS